MARYSLAGGPEATRTRFVRLDPRILIALLEFDALRTGGYFSLSR